MKQIGVWSITDDGPKRASKTDISLEKHLEDWIERDPGLLQSGLTIVGRQVHLSGLFLDLLAITPEGQWACIELKPGALYRETLAQALDYASIVSNMPGDELLACCNRLDDDKRQLAQGVIDQEADGDRAIIVMVVGTQVDPGLDSIVQFLSEGYSVPIRTTTFDVFQTNDTAKTRLLVRETVERIEEPKGHRRYSVDAIQNMAAEKGCREILDEVLQVGADLGLYVHPWPASVTLNPPFNRARTVAYAAPMPGGQLHIGYSRENITSLYPFTDADVDETVGQTENWSDADPHEVRVFLQQLRDLFSRIEDSDRAAQ